MFLVRKPLMKNCHLILFYDVTQNAITNYLIRWLNKDFYSVLWFSFGDEWPDRLVISIKWVKAMLFHWRCVWEWQCTHFCLLWASRSVIQTRLSDLYRRYHYSVRIKMSVLVNWALIQHLMILEDAVQVQLCLVCACLVYSLYLLSHLLYGKNSLFK